MTIFNKELLAQQKLVREDRSSGRVYIDNDANEYISVTTLLGRLPYKKKYLDEWRARVGEKEANRVSGLASYRGSQIHEALEKYLLGDPGWSKITNPFFRNTVLGLKEYLDKHVTTIYGVELQMFSKQLKSAGTADLVCLWDGKLSICDFKTSKRIKKRTDIFDYFLQGGAYAVMVEEIYGMRPEQIVIIMHVDHEKPQIFVEPISIYRDAVKKILPMLAGM